MNDIRSHLDRAAKDGVLTPAQLDKLLSYIPVAFGGRAVAQDHNGAGEFIVETEAPRFVRGFHDILITVGLSVLLSGLFGITGFIGTFPAIIILAELLVRIQRLALPAIALTIATLIVAINVASIIVEEIISRQNSIVAPELLFLLGATIVFAIVGLFYWRYRVPFALASVYFLLAIMGVTVTYWALGKIVKPIDLLTQYPVLASATMLIAATALFVVALVYDLSDRYRVSRRSDVAFWMHLITAPALLYGALSFVLALRTGLTWDVESVFAATGALEVGIIVGILSIIGILIDRRAFVTSGIASLIATLVTLLSYSKLDVTTNMNIALLLVGLIVVTLGVGWTRIRRIFLSALPDQLAARLPPAR